MNLREAEAAETRLRPSLKVALIVAIFSLLLNLSFFLATPPEDPQHDARLYDTIARLLLGEGPADKTPSESRQMGLEGVSVRGLSYPLFLSLVYAVSGGGNYRLVSLLQALMLSATVFVSFLLGSAAFDLRTGVATALLYAFYLPAVWHTNFVLTETLLALLFTLAMWRVALFLNSETPRNGLAAGLMIAIIGISHPIWIVMPIVVIVGLFYYYRGQLGSRRVILSKLMFIIIGALVVLIPWNAFRVAFGLPQPGQAGTGYGAGGGFTFYAGSRVESRGLAVPEDYLVAETYFPPGRLKEFFEEEVSTGRVSIEPILRSIIEEKLASGDANDWVLTDFDYYRAGIENWLKLPLRIPQLLAYKIHWYLLDIATSPSYPLPEGLLHNQAIRIVYRIFNWPWVLLAIGGLVLVYRRHRKRFVLFVPLIFHTALVVLTYPDNRYKYPLLAPMFLLTALGWFWLSGNVARRLKKGR